MTAATRSSSVAPGVSNVISGRIIHKETSNGIANLQVDLFDLDNWPDPEVPPPTAASNRTWAWKPPGEGHQ